MYKTPEKPFDALEHARNKILRANQFHDVVMRDYIATYEDFWGLLPEGGSRYTTEEMQSVLDAMPQSTAIDILQDSQQFVAFVLQAYPGMLPEKYHTSAWNFSIGQSGIQLIGLRDIWLPVEEEQEEEETP